MAGFNHYQISSVTVLVAISSPGHDSMWELCTKAFEYFTPVITPILQLLAVFHERAIVKARSVIDQSRFDSIVGSGDNILEDVAVKERELFISDATDVYPASALRYL